jgi:hypothetical protein
MKQILKITFIVFLFAAFFAGCKKDKDSPSNYLQASDTTVKLSHGTLEDYKDPSAVGYWLGIGLLTSGITLDAEGYWDNAGSGIYFSIHSDSATSFPTGTYTFDDSEDPPTFTFDYADFCMKWTTDYENNVWVSLVSGTLKIVKNGDNYKITFNGVDENGDVVRGNYTGTLEYWDWGKKAAAAERKAGKR